MSGTQRIIWRLIKRKSKMEDQRMRTSLRKFGVAIAAAMAIAGASVAAPTAAQAQWHGGGGHWHGGGHGWGWGGFGLGLGTGLALGAAPYYGGYYGYGPYAYDYGPYGYGDCYIRRRLVSDGYGHRYWRRVRVCY
jgi:hypothetical protein